MASRFEGLGGDDVNDGASLSIETPLFKNTPLKIASGYFLINNYKALSVENGFITILKSNKNIISGRFTINGNYEDEKKGISEKYTITDGKFENLPVTVRYIDDFVKGFQRIY